MRFLIILMYYERPNMVKFALDSIAAQDYDNFEVAIIDDGSLSPIDPIVETYPFIDKVTIWKTHDSVQTKIEQGGSKFGLQINNAIDASDADVALMLCDDDALTRECLSSLNTFYSNHPEIKYAYGHVLVYNPFDTSSYDEINGHPITFLNNHVGQINPYCQVDASQVSWRLKPYKEAGLKFPYPQTVALDAAIYQQMFQTFGMCRFCGVFVQYKAVFPDQMGSRGDLYTVIDSGGSDRKMVS